MAYVDLQTEGHVLVIRVNRPEKYNALNVAMYHELGRAFARLDNEADLRAAVLCAEGRHFTAGIELNEWAPIFAAGRSFAPGPSELDPMGLVGPRHRKPVIIAVQGYTFTWGVEILLNCEIRVAARDTQFQMLEVQRGIYPCGGATIRLPREVGWANAQRVLLTGDRWDAETALRWGLVQELVEPGEQVPRALALARVVAEAAPLGVQGCLAATRYAVEHSHDEAVAQMMRDLVPVMRSEDAAEGVKSFVERRKAVFKGR